MMYFKRFSTTITIFDLDKNEWFEKNFNATKEVEGFYFLKIPKV